MAFAAILVGALALMQHSRGEDIAWVQASGGEVMVADGYAYHIFYSNGTFDVVEGGNIECLIVAGGGQGGDDTIKAAPAAVPVVSFIRRIMRSPAARVSRLPLARAVRDQARGE